MMRISRSLAVLACVTVRAVGATSSLWSSQPASNWSMLTQEAFPVGNGFLGIMPYNIPGHEKMNFNKDDLWSGGPFGEDNYTGGNPLTSEAYLIPGIQSWIFQNGSGNVSAIQNNFDDYGDYAVLANVSVVIDGIVGAAYQDYNRSLDLMTGVHTTTFAVNSATFTSQVYCSYPDLVCVYDLSSTSTLPGVSIYFEDEIRGLNLSVPSCDADSTSASITGITQTSIGMSFFAQARPVVSDSTVTVTCNAQGWLSVAPAPGRTQLAFVMSAGTNYDINKGTAADGFSFRGDWDPETDVVAVVSAAAAKEPQELLEAHVEDFGSYVGRFTLNLPDTQGFSALQTSEQIGNYSIDVGNPWSEAQQFHFGRYLFVSSSRDGGLPPNLQGKWAYSTVNAWSSDYHVDINLEMNHWGMPETGLSDLHKPLWDYMIGTWIGRGAETASLTYGGEGWIVHGYLNTFGSTGLPVGDDYWTLLTGSNAWLMLHVVDHFDFTGDVDWLQNTAYPLLLKPVAQYWMSVLVEDLYFHDGKLVVNPCISPEQPPTTFGCSHHQQLITSLLTNVLRLAPLAKDTDTAFLQDVASTLAQLDDGIHIGYWGQLQEWRLDIDVEGNEHRHLSHLIGWYPGSSVAGYAGGYFFNKTISDAVRTDLISRGPGIEDSNTGWEKVWRAACWARLNDTDEAYYELRLTLGTNIAPNLLSMYSGNQPPFQIDANFGFVGATVSMLVVDLPPQFADEGTRTVVLGPAIPPQWAGGSVSGLRLRGGAVVDFTWNDEGTVDQVTVAEEGSGDVRLVNVLGDELVALV